MDTTAFRSDLTAIPDALMRLADTLSIADDGVALCRSRSWTRVLVLGMGSSRYAAAQVTRRARVAGHMVWDELASTRDLPPAADDLLVIAVSATGGSAEVLAAVQPYVGHGRLLVLTNVADSPLAAVADAVSLLHAGVERSSVACRTYRHTHVVLERLISAATDGAPVERAPLDAAAAASARILAAEEEWAPRLDAALLGPHGLGVLASVENLGSAQQSALMIREVPRRPAMASESGDWAHVDVYTTLTTDYRALLFAGSHWDQQAVDWLQKRGSRFCVVGGELEGAEVSLRFAGDDDPRTRALVETLYAELIAERWRAADPEYSFAPRAG